MSIIYIICLVVTSNSVMCSSVEARKLFYLPTIATNGGGIKEKRLMPYADLYITEAIHVMSIPLSFRVSRLWWVDPG